MSKPIAVDILSDDEEDERHRRSGVVYSHGDVIDISTPVSTHLKKRRTDSNSSPTVFVIDDDPTPQKPSPGHTSTPSFVAETPLSAAPKSQAFLAETAERTSFASDCRTSSIKWTPSAVGETPIDELSRSGVSMVKCCRRDVKSLSNSEATSGTTGFICLESDNEAEDYRGFEADNRNKGKTVADGTWKETNLNYKFEESRHYFGNHDLIEMSKNGACSVGGDSSLDHPEEVTDKLEQRDEVPCPEVACDGRHIKKNVLEGTRKKKMSRDERIRLQEEKKQQREQQKLQKAAQRAEAAELKRLEKEKQKWEKGKFAQKSIVAEIDNRVVELGSIGGHLLTRFAEKGLSYCIKSNTIERSITWSMTLPEHLSEVAPESSEIAYILFIYEAEEFCEFVRNGFLLDHAKGIRSRFPNHTICYLTNRLMAYINKREQASYKNPANSSNWKRPPIEEVLSHLSTHFVRVHSRQCIDEAELAEHVVGLTTSLASCKFRKKLTRLSVNANGSLIPKDCIDRNLIKKNLWLKALIAIPKVQPRFAIAIWKRYPTMKSLLSAYMDPTKTVHEKEFLLKDLTIEGLLGDDRRLGEICSKRIYRILMAQCGSIRTDDVEDGADFFSQQSSEKRLAS